MSDGVVALQMAEDLLNILPIVVAFAVIISVAQALAGKDYESSDESRFVIDSDDDPIEPEGILKNRFAKGEISIEEYTERMARL